MPRQCSVCVHPDLAAIDAALVAGDAYRTIADRFGLSKTALIRHRENHLPATLLKAKQAEEVAQADTVLDQIRTICERTETLYKVSEGILAKAFKANDLRTALGAVREANGCNKEARNNMELLAELTKELDRSATVNVLVADPAWIDTRSKIVAALDPYPEAKQAVVQALGAGRG